MISTIKGGVCRTMSLLPKIATEVAPAATVATSKVVLPIWGERTFSTFPSGRVVNVAFQEQVLYFPTMDTKASLLGHTITREYRKSSLPTGDTPRTTTYPNLVRLDSDSCATTTPFPKNPEDWEKLQREIPKGSILTLDGKNLGSSHLLKSSLLNKWISDGTITGVQISNKTAFTSQEIAFLFQQLEDSSAICSRMYLSDLGYHPEELEGEMNVVFATFENEDKMVQHVKENSGLIDLAPFTGRSGFVCRADYPEKPFSAQGLVRLLHLDKNTRSKTIYFSVRFTDKPALYWPSSSHPEVEIVLDGALSTIHIIQDPWSDILSD